MLRKDFFVFDFGWLVSKESSLESWAPGHVVIAEGSNEVDSSQKSLRQAKAFDSSKEKDTRERSVMGQEKSARGESTSLFLSSSIFTDHRALNQFLAFLSVFLFAAVASASTDGQQHQFCRTINSQQRCDQNDNSELSLCCNHPHLPSKVSNLSKKFSFFKYFLQKKRPTIHSVWKSEKKVSFNNASEASYVYIYLEWTKVH